MALLLELELSPEVNPAGSGADAKNIKRKNTIRIKNRQLILTA